MPRLTTDQIAELRRLYCEGLSYREMQEAFDICGNTIALHTRDLVIHRQQREDERIAELRRLYVESSESCRSLMGRFHISPLLFAKIIADLPRRKPVISAEDRELVKRLRVGGMTYEEIEAATGFTETRVRNLCKGLPKPKRPAYNVIRLPKETYDEVRRLYLAGEPIASIKERFGFKDYHKLYEAVADLPKRNAYLTQPERERIELLRMRGMSIVDIAETVKRSTYLVAPVCREVDATRVKRERVMSVYCRVCPAGEILFALKPDIVRSQVKLTCPICGTLFSLAQLVTQEELNAALANHAKAREPGGTDPDMGADS